MSAGNTVFDFERSANVLLVVPTGSLMEFRDSDIRNAYNDTYRRLDDPDIVHLLVDFCNLDYFGSTFVGVLLRLAKKTRQGGGDAALCNLSDHMQQMMQSLMLLENTKTDFFWSSYSSRDEAMKALSQGPSAKPEENGDTN